MTRSVLAFPVLPGKSATEISDGFRARPREYEESRRRLGITLERAYLQKTPMGDFVVAYVEAGDDFIKLGGRMASSPLEIDRYFAKKVNEIHGMDLRQTPSGSPPRIIAEWVDPQVTERREGMAFCAPLLPDAVEDAERYLSRAYASGEFADSRRKLGENAEIASLQHTPQGPLGVVYLEGMDPIQANRRFAASTDPFDVSFKEELRNFFPPEIDFGKPIPGIEELFDSSKVASLETTATGRKVA